MHSDDLTPAVTSTATLASGLRVVHRLAPGAPVEYFGLAIDAGSRDERYGEYGLAHFVEHTIFKGTRRRRSWHILNRMEAIGGELNAYTTKEETMLYTLFPAGALDRAAELLSDLVTSSVFPPSELRKEQEVVIDEINSYLDTPADSVFDDFDDLFFANTPLGHNILGSVDSVRSFTSDDCLRWLSRCYTIPRLVAFYQGPAPLRRVAATVERRFSALSPGGEPPERTPASPVPEPFAVTRRLDNHQAHTVIGCPLPGIYSPHRTAIALINNILGGPGMNSLLNLELRERRGLVYAVDSSTTLYTDTGLLSIYLGCDPDDVGYCCRLVDRTLRALPERLLSPRALAAAKRQYAGQLIVASQNSEQMCLSTARAALRGLPAPELRATLSALEALTPEGFEPLLPMLAPERFSRLTLA